MANELNQYLSNGVNRALTVNGVLAGGVIHRIGHLLGAWTEEAVQLLWSREPARERERRKPPH